jgi:hypothetical protein
MRSGGAARSGGRGEPSAPRSAQYSVGLRRSAAVARTRHDDRVRMEPPLPQPWSTEPVPALRRRAVALTAAAPHVSLVSGPSGVGKSTVLSVVGDGLVPPVAQAFASERLDGLILKQAADALRLLVREPTDLDVAAERLLAAAADLARHLGRDLADAVVAQLWDKLTAGIGPEFQRRVRPLSRRFRERSPAGVLEAVERLVVVSPRETVAAVLGQVVEMAAGRSLWLRIDDAERLDDPSRRLLADLAETLPEGVHMALAHRTGTERSHAALLALIEDAPAIAHLQLGVLTRDEIAEWFAAPANRPALPTVPLERLEGHTPLHIATLMHETSAPALLSAPPSIEVLVRATVGALSPGVREAALRLALLHDRPPERALGSLLAPARVRDTRSVDRELQVNGLMSATSTGAWFHDEIRGALLGTLSVADRAAYAADAIPVLIELSALDHTWLPNLLSCARDCGSLPRELRAVRDASDDAIALLAAHVELAGTEGRPIAATQVRPYAGQVWSANESLEGALEQLIAEELLAARVESGLLQLRNPGWRAGALQMLQARCLARLGRVPLPELREALLHFALAPTLRGASDMYSTLGPARIGDLVRSAGATAVDRDAPEPALLVRARFRAAEVGAVAKFDDAARRDRAVRRLRDRRIPVFGKVLEVESIEPYPLPPVDSERWPRAIELLTGHMVGDWEALTVDPPLGARAAQVARAEVVELFASEMDYLERWAAGLDRPLAFAVGVTPEGSPVVAEIAGGRTGVVELPQLGPRLEVIAAYGLDFEQRLNLRYGEELLTTSFYADAEFTEHPVVLAARSIVEASRSFNHALPRMVLPMDDLPAAIERGLRRQARDAGMLSQELEMPRGRCAAWHVSLALPAAPPGSGGEAWAAYRILEADEPICDLVWCENDIDLRNLDALHSLFPHPSGVSSARSVSRLIGHGISSAGSAIAQFLAVDPDDLLISDAPHLTTTSMI